jgi:hypothetical protein
MAHSSAAKNAEAERKIAFARRSSRFSRSSSASRIASLVVMPGRSPASTSDSAHPAAQGLGVDPELLTYPLARTRPHRRVLLRVEHEPDRPITQFVRILPWRHHRRGSSFQA